MDATISNTINFVGYSDASTYFQLAKLLNPPPKTWSKSGVIIICSVVCAGGVVVVQAITLANKIPISSIWPILIIFAFIIFLAFGLASIISKLTNKYTAKHLNTIYEKNIQKTPRTGSISPEVINILFADGKTEIQWTHFDRLIEIDGAVGLCKQSRLVDVLSRSMFQSQETGEIVRKFALGKVQISR
jgi:hypothetical protein